jgi:hypothetical protein
VSPINFPLSADICSEPAQASTTHVSWEQVRAFRVVRHHLARRAPRQSVPTVLGDIGGAQAQLLSAAQVSIADRVRDLKPEDLDTALWEDRTLAKAWCMRRTLHLLPSKELATFVRGSARRAEKEIRWMRKHGVSESELSALLDAVLASLDESITRRELAERVSRSLELPMRWKEGGGWGSERRIPCVRLGPVTCPAYYMLHLVGARGVVCSGPNRSNEATFVRADAWIPYWRDLPVDRAEDELLRSYLRGFGPATVRDFVAWTRMTLGDALGIWDRVVDELSPVNVEGWAAWVLRKDLPDLETSRMEHPTVRLLPYFDSYLLGHMERGHLVDAGDHSRVYRNQGWVAPVVLVDGRVQGVWSHDRAGNRLRVKVRPLNRIPRSVTSALQAEADELGSFLGCRDTEVLLLSK